MNVILYTSMLYWRYIFSYFCELWTFFIGALWSMDIWINMYIYCRHWFHYQNMVLNRVLNEIKQLIIHRSKHCDFLVTWLSSLPVVLDRKIVKWYSWSLVKRVYINVNQSNGCNTAQKVSWQEARYSNRFFGWKHSNKKKG